MPSMDHGREGKDPSDINRPGKRKKRASRRTLEGFAKRFSGGFAGMKFFKDKEDRPRKDRPERGSITGRKPRFHGRGSRTGDILG